MKVAIIINNEDLLNRYLLKKDFTILYNKGFLLYELNDNKNKIYLVKVTNNYIEISTTISYLILNYNIQYFISNNITDSYLEKFHNYDTIYSSKIGFFNDEKQIKVSEILTNKIVKNENIGLVSTIENINQISMINPKSLSYDYISYYVAKSAKFLNRNVIAINTLCNSNNIEQLYQAFDINIKKIFEFINI